MSEDNKDQKDAVEALAALRENFEKKDALSQEAVAKANTKLDALEVKNQEIVLAAQEAATAATAEKDAAEVRFKSLEARALRMGSADQKEVSLELKALESFISKGAVHVGPEEAKYLRTDVDTAGGYLAPSEFTKDIVKYITEISPVRQIARVRNTSSKSVEIPVRTAGSQGGWAGEGQDITGTDSAYGMVEIPVHKLSSILALSTEMLQDSAFNMESEINADIVEDFASKEGNAFVLGDGIKKPTGFMTSGDVGVTTSTTAGKIDADSLIEVVGTLKDGYNGVYVLNGKTLAAIRALQDTQGNYLFNGGLAAGVPSTINGQSYVVMSDMADEGSLSLAVAYGDFGRAYTIVDGVALSFMRDDYTLAGSGKVRVIANKRVGGDLVNTEAIKYVKCLTV